MAAVAIQKTYRGFIERVIKCMLVKRKMAAVTIQKTYRGVSQRIAYCVLISNVIITQSSVRRWISWNEIYEMWGGRIMMGCV